MSRPHTTSFKSKSGMMQFYGFEELAKKLDGISESDIKKIIEDCLQKSSEPIKNDMLEFMKAHHDTGQTEESFITTDLVWEGNVCKGNVGFDIDKGGIASIFLDVGTPKQKPYYFIYYAVNNNMDKVKKIQSQALKDILEKVR